MLQDYRADLEFEHGLNVFQRSLAYYKALTSWHGAGIFVLLLLTTLLLHQYSAAVVIQMVFVLVTAWNGVEFMRLIRGRIVR